jgi:ABC-2 type transport system permease protein
MSKFLTLVSIENTKMWKRISTKVMLIFVVVIVVAATSIVRYHEYSIGTDVNAVPAVVSAADWKVEVQHLQKDITALKAQIIDIDNGTNNPMMRREIGSLQKNIAEDQYRIDKSISAQEPDSIWTRLTDFNSEANYGAIIALMLIIACAAAIAGEFSEGTIKMAISRPYHRHEILSAKLIASLLFGLALLAAILISNFIMFAIFYGVHGWGAMDMLWTSSRVLYVPAALKMLAVFGLDFLQVIFFVVVAFTLSAVTRSRSIATGFSLFLLLVGVQIVTLLALYFSWGRYLPFAMTNFSGYLLSGAGIEGTTLGMALILTGIYTLIIGAVGYVVFAKRDI